MHLYFIVIIVISVLLIIITISLLFIIRYKRKTVVLTDSIFHQKNNFHVLLTKYMELYRSKCDKGTVYDDANKFLSALHNRYESLSKSDIAIIWLILLSFSREDICSTLIIGKEYYHQRRTNISKTLKLGTTRNLDKDLKTFVPEFLANNNL